MRQIGFTRWRQHPQIQTHHRIAAGDLDLGQPVADGQGFDQPRQFFQQATDPFIQNLAAAQIGQIRTAPLAETDQHPPLFGHVLNAQPRPPPITPDRPGQRFQHLFGLNLADVGQAVQQPALLARQLCGRVEMLQGAAAADSEMGAAWLDPFRCRRQHLQRARLIVATAPRRVRAANFLSRQRALDEHGLALAPRHAVTLMGQILNADDKRRHRRQRLPLFCRRTTHASLLNPPTSRLNRARPRRSIRRFTTLYPRQRQKRCTPARHAHQRSSQKSV